MNQKTLDKCYRLIPVDMPTSEKIEKAAKIGYAAGKAELGRTVAKLIEEYLELKEKEREQE